LKTHRVTQSLFTIKNTLLGRGVNELKAFSRSIYMQLNQDILNYVPTLTAILNFGPHVKYCVNVRYVLNLKGNNTEKYN